MLFIKADKAMKKLGFEKIEESKFGVTYRRENKQFNFIERLDICHKANGNHLIMPYIEGINSDGLNNSGALTYSEMKTVMKKYRELKRKYKW